MNDYICKFMINYVQNMNNKILKFGATSTSDNKGALVSISPAFRDFLIVLTLCVVLVFNSGNKVCNLWVGSSII